MAQKVLTTKDIDISGSKAFIQKTYELIAELKRSGIPLKIRRIDEIKEQVEDEDTEAIIKIELNEPINKVKTALIRITNHIDSHEAIVQKFKLTINLRGPYVLGLTISMKHPLYKITLRNELEKLIGKLA